MIGVYIFIALCIVAFEVLITWIKCLLDYEPHDPYEYCYDCKRGFCMEEPMTNKCIKWMEEKNEV